MVTPQALFFLVRQRKIHWRGKDKDIEDNLVMECLSNMVYYSNEKHKSLHLVFVTDSQKVTWAASTIFAIFVRFE